MPPTYTTNTHQTHHIYIYTSTPPHTHPCYPLLCSWWVLRPGCDDGPENTVTDVGFAEAHGQDSIMCAVYMYVCVMCVWCMCYVVCVVCICVWCVLVCIVVCVGVYMGVWCVCVVCGSVYVCDVSSVWFVWVCTCVWCV